MINSSINSSIDNDKSLCNMINAACNKFKNDIIFVGDFNYPKINWSSIITKDVNNMANNTSDLFLTSLKNNFLIQHILQPTRIRENQNQNILDLLITNGDFIDSVDYLEPVGHSDHVVLKFNYPLMDSIEPCINPIYCNDKGDYDTLRNFVQNDTQYITINNQSDVNNIWNQMKLIILEGVKKFVPIVKSSSNSKKHHKIGNELKNDIKRKHIMDQI